MTPEQFVFWLKGFIDRHNNINLSIEQAEEIMQKVEEVSSRLTPSEAD